MSIWVNWRIAIIKDRDLSTTAKGLALYLNTYMNDRQDTAWPSIATICGEMNMSTATAVKYLGELETSGYIVKQKRYGKTVVYHALIPEKVTLELGKTLSISNRKILPDLAPSFLNFKTSVFQTVKTNKQKNKQDNTNTIKRDSFEDFWERYPRKVDKKKARSAWQRLSRTDQDRALAHLASKPFAKTEKQFIPHPTTYIHGERWDDYEEKQSYAGAI